MSRLGNKIARTWRKTLFSTGMEGMLYPSHRSGDIIVMYHGVDLEGDQRYNLRHISREDLRRQLRYFRKEYEVVPLQKLYDKPNPGIRRLALTFDDGLENNFKHAAPVLRSLGLPATFFVTSIRSIQHNNLWQDAMNVLVYYSGETLTVKGLQFRKLAWNRFEASDGTELMSFVKHQPWEYIQGMLEELRQKTGKHELEVAPLHTRVMNEDQIRTLDRHALFEIGCHSHRHVLLEDLDEAEAEKEMQLSKDYLEQILQKQVRSIAFPDGSYKRSTLDIAEKLGFCRQLAVNYQYSEDLQDPRVLNRFGVYEDRSWVEQLHQVNRRFHEEPRAMEAQ